ncbi:DUF2971 domain-containing protein [Stenotrophomonas indicatrix]|uniref:DUF2971 domain-containing protein n=1 Tax=Stenotrophomonas indicatrix TaxID=2045451 RepID=UPI00143192BD|nr:DUF2971 domain-containing protein [Stenotrophomonas indicatrix]
MNDSMEMHWGIQRLRAVTGEMLKPEAGKQFEDILGTFSETVTFLASCFSTKRDMLSQWRAYAEDAAGYCVGFDANLLSDLPHKLLKVCYEEGAQLKMIQSSLMGALDPSPTAEAGQARAMRLLEFIRDLVGFKNPGFEEEQEVRLVYALGATKTDDGIRRWEAKPEPAGKPANIRFMMRGSVPSAYVDFDLPWLNAGIREIVIGPRSNASEKELSLMLGTLGFKDVKIEKAKASYRRPS